MTNSSSSNSVEQGRSRRAGASSETPDTRTTRTRTAPRNQRDGARPYGPSTRTRDETELTHPPRAISGQSGGRGRSPAPFLIYMGPDAERRLGASSRSQDDVGGDFNANWVYAPHTQALR